MRIAGGTCVVAQCHPCAYKYTLTAVIISSSTLARTLAPPLALDDAGDEALRCRNLSNAVLTSSFPLGVSNQFTGRPARISVERGTLLVMWEESAASVVSRLASSPS